MAQGRVSSPIMIHCWDLGERSLDRDRGRIVKREESSSLRILAWIQGIASFSLVKSRWPNLVRYVSVGVWRGTTGRSKAPPIFLFLNERTRNERGFESSWCGPLYVGLSPWLLSDTPIKSPGPPESLDAFLSSLSLFLCPSLSHLSSSLFSFREVGYKLLKCKPFQEATCPVIRRSAAFRPFSDWDPWWLPIEWEAMARNILMGNQEKRQSIIFGLRKKIYHG